MRCFAQKGGGALPQMQLYLGLSATSGSAQMTIEQLYSHTL